MSSVRRFAVGGRLFHVEGLAPEDPYLTSIGRRFETPFQALCQRVLTDGTVAMDVGANIGATALIMSAHVGSGVVHAFEPGRSTFDLLRRNMAANSASNVVCHPYALSDQPGEMGFAENSAYGHLTPAGESSTTVAVHTVDQMVEALDLQRLDLLKIDTEGFEPQVLAGARAAIERFRPVIFCELNAWTLLAYGGSNPLDFLSDLTRRFAHVYRVGRGGRRLVLEEIAGDPPRRAILLLRDNLVYFNAFNDLVICPDEGRADMLRDLVIPSPDQPRRHPVRRLLSAVRQAIARV